MPIIQKSDIVGARITQVHSVCQIDDDGLDFATTYFTVDRGFSFVMPWPGFEWETQVVPANAELLPDESVAPSFSIKRSLFFGTKVVRDAPIRNDIIRRIKQQTIVGVYCHRRENNDAYGPDDAMLILADGSRVTCASSAPHGTGAVGLYHLTDTQSMPQLADLVDFFDLPAHPVPDFYAEIVRIAPYLNCLEKAFDAHVHYDGLSGALIWSDELPSVDYGDQQAIRQLLRYRTSVITGTPVEGMQPYWEAAQQAFPMWPGFSPERCQYSAELKSQFDEMERVFYDSIQQGIGDSD